MAAVIGDYASDLSSRFHTMIATSQHSQDSACRSSHRHSSSPRGFCRGDSSPNTRYQQSAPWDSESAGPKHPSTAAGASRIPSPPSSSSESLVNQNCSKHDNTTLNMAQNAQESTHVRQPTAPPQPQSLVGPTPTMPSPESQNNSPAPQPLVADDPVDPKPIRECKTIHVRDLQHIRSLARNDTTGNGPGILNEPPLQSMKYEISAMPIHDIIEMVAALLTKITTTNDLQHDAMSRNAAHQQSATSHNDGSSTMSPFSSSVLAFHGKNVPAITILSYLARIHKYCPTTYEVFLSLLVYFDRMTERVNDIVMKAEKTRQQPEQEGTRRKEELTNQAAKPDPESEKQTSDGDTIMADAADGESLADEDSPTTAPAPATYFVVDSFNIHRLIIAGVTCASKFFSDVFYTNSRYAKVGGLPLAELNHLELQFLLLNDFRLAVPVEDLEAYATMLVEFYAREVVNQKSRPGSEQLP